MDIGIGSASWNPSLVPLAFLGHQDNGQLKDPNGSPSAAPSSPPQCQWSLLRGTSEALKVRLAPLKGWGAMKGMGPHILTPSTQNVKNSVKVENDKDDLRESAMGWSPQS